MPCRRSSGNNTIWRRAAAAGSPVWLVNADLTPGREYLNVFSTETGSGIPGAGPLFGLYAQNPAAIVAQLGIPAGTLPFHFVADVSYARFGPYSLPPVVADFLCLEVDAGGLRAWSGVSRIRVH